VPEDPPTHESHRRYDDGQANQKVHVTPKNGAGSLEQPVGLADGEICEAEDCRTEPYGKGLKGFFASSVFFAYQTFYIAFWLGLFQSKGYRSTYIRGDSALLTSLYHLAAFLAFGIVGYELVLFAAEGKTLPIPSVLVHIATESSFVAISALTALFAWLAIRPYSHAASFNQLLACSIYANISFTFWVIPVVIAAFSLELSLTGDTRWVDAFLETFGRYVRIYSTVIFVALVRDKKLVPPEVKSLYWDMAAITMGVGIALFVVGTPVFFIFWFIWDGWFS